MENSRVTTYLKQLKDGNDDFRVAAARALGRIGDVAAIRGLIEALGDRDEEVRHAAARALGKIDDVGAIPALIEAYKDRNEYVRWAAVSARLQIGDPGAFAALLAASKDPHDYVRSAAVEALGAFGDDAGLAWSDAAAYRRVAAREASTLAGRAVPALIEALTDRSDKVQKAAAAALGKLGDTSAAPMLLKALTHKSKIVRTAAAEALAKIDEPRNLPSLIIAEARVSAQKRIEALEGLRHTRYSDAHITLPLVFPSTEQLCELLLTNGDAEAKRGARTILNWLHGDSELIVAYQHDAAVDAEELMRASHPGATDAHPDTLLRASGEADTDREARQTLWQRIFGRAG